MLLLIITKKHIPESLTFQDFKSREALLDFIVETITEEE